jgi:hypothetical protein
VQEALQLCVIVAVERRFWDALKAYENGHVLVCGDIINQLNG